MSSAPDKNQKLPDQVPPGEYPYVAFSQYRDGSWDRQDSTPNNETRAFGHRTGTYYEIDQTGAWKIYSCNTSHSYTQAGSTETVDLNSHVKHGGSHCIQTTSDTEEERGGDRFGAFGGENVHATHGEHFDHATGGHTLSASGDFVVDHDSGNHHQNVDGDHVVLINGNKYERIGGEHGIYVPAGNMDILVSSGSLRICVGGSTLLMTGDKITLTSPTIVLDSSNILLGGENASNPLAMLGTVDTCGCSDVDNLSTTTKTV